MVDWLLTGTPREAQLEALRRAYTGYALDDAARDICEAQGRAIAIAERPLPHAGRPARGYGYFMEPRLGKTPTSLNEFMLLKRDFDIRRKIVFSPNTYKFTWGIEVEKFGVDTEHFVHDVDKKLLTSALKQMKEGVCVVNYEAMIQPEVRASLMDWVTEAPTMISLDESVKVKNSDSTTFKAIHALTKEAAYIRALTGIPAPQSPLDYFGQIKQLGGLDGRNKFGFRATYCKMGGFKGKKVVGVKNPERLAELLDQHAFVARRQDWMNWWASDYEVMKVPMLPEQNTAYREMEQDFITWLDDGTKISVEMAANKHAKLQQISSGFMYDEEGKTHAIVPFEKTPKFLDLLERLEERITGKVIIVYVHRPVGECLYDLLAKFKPALIAGKLRMKQLGLDIDAEKARFNGDPSCRVILCQETAAKYGHTLVGNPADPCGDVIFYENTYSRDDRGQMEERPQGASQTGPISILDYASSKVERAVVTALQEKKRVGEIVMEHYRNLRA